MAIALLSILVFRPAQAFLEAISDTTRVYVAEDKTRESGCWETTEPVDDSGVVLRGAKPCKPGTVWSVRETSYREARQKGIRYFVIKTNNAKADQANLQALFAPSRVLGECPHVPSKMISYQYWAKATVGFIVQVKYRVNTDCSVTNIYDRSRLTAYSYGACWTASELAGMGSGQVYRKIWMDPSYDTKYTAWQGGLTKSFVGKVIYHYSDNDSAVIKSTFRPKRSSRKKAS